MFIRVKETIGPYQLDEAYDAVVTDDVRCRLTRRRSSGAETISLDAGDIYAIRYRPVQALLKEGQIELI